MYGDYAGIVLLVVLYYIRASVIGVKYACYGDKGWNRVKKEEIPSAEIFGNLTLVKWLKDRQDQILFEVMASELRRDCYGHPGKITFMSYDGSTIQSFKTRLEKTVTDYEKTLDDLAKTHNQKYHIESLGVTSWGHRSIFLTLVFSKAKIGLASNPLNIILMLACPFIPAFGRLIYKQSFHGDNWY